MNAQRRADLAIQLSRMLIQAVEKMALANEQNHERLNLIYEAHDIDPIPYEEVAVEITKLMNESRQTLVLLEEE